MTETFEFRLADDDAERYLPAGAGIRIGIARKIEVAASDPLFREIERVDRLLREDGKHGLVTAWQVRREYSKEEKAHAALLQMQVRRVFEPAGEECGTKYDETTACGLCGAGATQVTPLLLPKRRLPKGVDAAQTIAGEVIVSARTLELFARHALTGARFEAVRFPTRENAKSTGWFQLRTTSLPVDVDRTTHIGRTPFDQGEPDDVCPRGDRVGYGISSELFVARASHDGSDLVSTKQFFGVRRGLVRPNSLLLVSTRAWHAIETAGLKGLRFEIAHLV